MKLKTIVPVILSLCIAMGSSVNAAGYVYGDADNSDTLTILDCTKIIQYVLNPYSVTMTDEEFEKADVNNSGTLTSEDAAIVLQMLLDSSYKCPAELNSDEDSTEATTEGGGSSDNSYDESTTEAAEVTTESTTEAATEATTEAATESSTETTTEAAAEADTEATTEAATETTTEAVEYYIQLSDSSSKVYDYTDGVIGDEITSTDKVSVDGDVISILSAGTYYAEGTLSEGQISVSDELSKSEKVVIYLMGVDVTNSTTAPFNGGGSKITLYLVDGTTNTFTDNSTAAYSGYVTSSAPKGALYSKRDLTIDESGSLIVNGNYSNGLVCGADLTIKGNANVTVNAVKNGIKGDNGVSFGKKTGTINVTSGGDGIKSDAISSAKYYTSDGSQLSSKVDGIEADKGYVEIKGGTFTINAGGDGIQADNYFNMSAGTLDITAVENGIKANEALLYVVETGDDDNDYITYDESGNIIYLSSTMNISGGTITIDSGEDGLRACEKLNISGGDINISVSYDALGDTSDGIQVGKNTDTSTTNTDGSTVDTREITVKGTLTVSGGTINIEKATDDGIVSNGDFTMTGGTITGSSDCDFFKIYENVTISDGTIDITPGCDGIQAGKALTTTTDTSGNETDSDYTEGNINISGGTFNITANEGTSNTTITDDSDSCKGIKTTKYMDISGGTFNINSADDSIHSDYNIIITGGAFDLATLDDGIHADNVLTLGTSTGTESDFTIDISTSYEGIEGSVINIYSGTTYIYSTDDGVNAAGYYDTNGNYYSETTSSSGSGWNGNMWGGGNQMADDTAPYGMLYIKGGYVYVEAPNGDGLDSNGSVEMSDGVVIVNGPGSNSENDVFDYGDSNSDYFKLTGGTLIGAGYNMSNTSISVSGQGYASTSSSSSGMGGMMPGGSSGGTSSGSKGTPVKVTTNSGNIVFVPKVNWGYMFISTPDMTSGSNYSISTVSSYSGGTNILGVTDNGTYYGLIENVD